MTKGGTTHRWRMYPSPDGKQLAHDVKGGELWLLDLATGKDERIDSTNYGDDAYRAVAWSADSSAIAFVRPDSARQLDQLLIYSLASRKSSVLTSDRYESFSPAFSPDGRWLYFLSNRHFEPTPGGPWGDRNMGPMFDRRTRIYALALQKGQRFPFQPKDELAPAKDQDEEKEKDKEKEKEATPPPIEFDGLAERLFVVPAPPGNYGSLAVAGERLYWLAVDHGRDAKPRLATLEISDDGPEPATFAAEVQDFALSADRKQLYFMKAVEDGAGAMFVVEAGKKVPEDLAKAKVRVGDWMLPITPREEWREMFVDAWRMHRDFSFDARMRGQDWDAVRARYEPLVERVADRAELDDLLGQMIGELGILHSQVRGAEHRRDRELAAPASLGARFEGASGGVRIAHVYRTETELPEGRGPLDLPGVDAREGDLIVAVNGRPVGSAGDVAAALQGQAGEQVLLELSRDGKEHRTVAVAVDMERDAQLRYSDWRERTRAAVETTGQGRIGYLHLRAMGPNDLADFARDFYASFDRDGLVVDVRRNRGGNIDSWVLEKLMRRAWAFWQPAKGERFWNMQQTFRGHLAVLIDGMTYSDGETFAAGVKALGLGPLIGTRTAGAGIWLTDRNRLADGGIARIAELAQFDLEGRWLIEGRGVAPDLEVENPPVATYEGHDRQLEAALAYLREKIAAEPVREPEPEPIPPRAQ